MKNYDSLDKSFNISADVVNNKIEEKSKIDIVTTTSNDINKDYEYTRANLYSLIEKGQEAINGIMELAG